MTDQNEAETPPSSEEKPVISAPVAQRPVSEPILEGTVEPESPVVSSSSKRKSVYELGKGRLGRAVNGVLKLVEKRYPNMAGQLVLDDFEIELLDDALKPFVDKYLKKAKVEANNIEIILAVVIIVLPRIFVFYDETHKSPPRPAVSGASP